MIGNSRNERLFRKRKWVNCMWWVCELVQIRHSVWEWSRPVRRPNCAGFGVAVAGRERLAKQNDGLEWLTRAVACTVAQAQRSLKVATCQLLGDVG